MSKKFNAILSLTYYSDAENTPVAEDTPGKSMTDEQYRCSMEGNDKKSNQSVNDKHRINKEKEDKIKKQMQEKRKPN